MQSWTARLEHIRGGKEARTAFHTGDELRCCRNGLRGICGRSSGSVLFVVAERSAPARSIVVAQPMLDSIGFVLSVHDESIVRDTGDYGLQQD